MAKYIKKIINYFEKLIPSKSSSQGDIYSPNFFLSSTKFDCRSALHSHLAELERELDELTAPAINDGSLNYRSTFPEIMLAMRKMIHEVIEKERSESQTRQSSIRESMGWNLDSLNEWGQN